MNIDYNEYKPDAFVLVDVLYLIEFDDQRKIISSCYNSLKKDGILLIKAMSKEPKWKYFIDHLEETLSVRVFKITLGRKFYHFDENEFVDELTKVGFKVSNARLDKYLPHPHIAYICKKER